MSFTKQTSFEVAYAPSVISKWRSTRTGLQLVYINQPSPIVNGYFAVATEIKNDSGCPHTLEHLIFMGLKKFPYKGMLDTVGNRLFSSTNAWTGVDQTVYTLTTAGWDGFRSLLPVYLDHLLHPTLTEEACMTEVYHVDGQGEEKGVVFSEMQGIESESWFITFLELQRTMYKKSSGYSSETGGLMSELRHLTNDHIRKFHQDNYRPDNLSLIVTGTVDEEELLKVVSDFDEELPSLPKIPWKRPFVDSEPDLPLAETIAKEVEFPEKDESMGELIIGWIGPPGNDVLVNTAIDIIGCYFTDSPISILTKHLVEIENPLANEIDFGTDDYVRTGMHLTFSSIPTESLHVVDTKVKELIKEQADPANVDVEYLRQLVNQQKLKLISRTEKSPKTFVNIAILDFIYGKVDGSELVKWSEDLQEYEELATWSAEQWSKIIREYFVENHSASIIGKPSKHLNKKMKKDQKEYAQFIQNKYGAEGLKKLGDKLESAQTVNNKPIPDDIITLFSRPDPSKIPFIKTEAFRAGNNKMTLPIYLDEDPFTEELKADTPSDFPLAFHFENYRSQFTTVDLFLSSTTIDKPLLKYMSIIEEIFSLSIQLPSGEYIPYDKVISQINDTLVAFHLDNGFDGDFYELIDVKVKFENKDYAKAVDWLLNVVKYTIFEESRVKIIIEKIINSIPEKKRNGELMMYSTQYRNLYTEGSLRKAQDALYTESFYKDLLAKIEDGKYSEIQHDLEKLRSQLFSLDNMKVFVVGDAKQLQAPVSTWKKFAEAFTDKSARPGLDFQKNLPRAFEFKSDVAQKCSGDAYLTVVPSIESSYLMSMTPMPTDYSDDDVFKILLAAEFLRALEGPLYRAVRGTGLAYDASVRQSVEAGFLYYNVYRGADPIQAWHAGKKVIEDLANNTVKIDEVDLQSAVAGIVNGIAGAESNAYEAAIEKFSDDVLKKRGPNFTSTYLRKLNEITPDGIRYILKKYYMPLFDAKKSMIFAGIPPTKCEDIELFLRKESFNVTIEEIGGSDDMEVDESGSESESGSETESESESDEE